jgi:hypothetical protein
MGQPNRIPTLVWADPVQVDFLAAVAMAASLEVVAAGSAVRGQSGAVASAFSATMVDDLRSTLATTSAELVLLGSVGDFGAGDAPQDSRAVAAAAARGVKIATLEPIPSSALDLEPGGWVNADSGPAPAQSVRIVGLARLSTPFRDSDETLTSFGPARTAIIESFAAPCHGSLGARLMSSMDLALSLFGDIASVSAACAGAAGAPGPVSTQALRELQGDLSAIVRCADGRNAMIAVSNRAGRWGSCITLLSENGRLRFFDDGFEWIGPDGHKRDELRLSQRTRGSEAPDHAVAVVADAVSRLMDPAKPDAGPVNIGSILALSQAALLSARTGQSESPATITGMMAAGS